jgi:hypothetical protein
MFGKIKDAARVVASVAGETIGAGFETLKGPLDELSAASPDLERIGYRVKEIELVCSLLPRIVVYLARDGAVSEETVQAVLAAHPGNRTFSTLVGLLRQADRLLDRVKLKGRRCTGLAVELGVPPCVRVMYTAADTAAVPASGSGQVAERCDEQRQDAEQAAAPAQGGQPEGPGTHSPAGGPGS